jgi:CBS domain-containing protein
MDGQIGEEGAMKVDAVLRAKGHEVATVSPTATLATVAQRLRLEKIGALVVLDEGRLAGIISERDVVHAFAAHRAATSEIKVAEVMTKDVITCRPEDDLTRILGVMTRHRVRHLPVLEGGRLVGLVSIGDAVKHRLAELETETAVLRDAYIAVH